MSSSVDWKAVKYEEAFSEELRGLQRRREMDPGFTVKDLEGVLQHLYIKEGQNWEGQGDVQDISIAATIAAYECFISQWKADKTAVN